MDYVIIAEFRAQPGKIDELLELLKSHATHSNQEPGCQVFDLCQDTSDPDLVLLYEVYDDKDAFLAHQDTPHYARFRANTPNLVIKDGDNLFVGRKELSRH